MPLFSLVLPVLDEENIIEKVIDDIKKVLDNSSIQYEIILVENESLDNTWAKINKLAAADKRIRVTKTIKGYGSAVTAGLKIAKWEYVGYMPSDGQIDNSILPILWNEINSSNIDLVKIKRANRESTIRFVRSKIFNILARLLFPIDVSDINGSPRIFKREKLQLLDLKYKDSFIDTEFAIKAHILKWRIKEIPMKNLERTGGTSTVRIKTVIEFITNLINYRLSPELKNWKTKYHLS